MKMLHLLLMAALTGLCATASAQWQWINKDGHKVFSDRAPPTEIPDKNILKRPGNRAPMAPASDAAEGTDAPAAPQGLPVPVKPAGGLDKELEAKKKQAKEAEAAKRKAAEEEVTKAKVENCARAKQAKITFESGVRVGRTNAAGEREIMDDAARAEELKRIQGIIAKDCR
ncbi:MAG: DUF4124 domain-containing protein [Burkholderiales bacterium]|nr:DUF4124 domain-containing protein [Burkholderiales bacterium]